MNAYYAARRLDLQLRPSRKPDVKDRDAIRVLIDAYKALDTAARVFVSTPTYNDDGLAALDNLRATLRANDGNEGDEYVQVGWRCSRDNHLVALGQPGIECGELLGCRPVYVKRDGDG